MRRYDEGIEIFHSVLEREPTNLYALNHMGLAYRQIGEFDKAEAVLRTALDIDPGCERSENRNTHNYLGLVYEDKGQLWEAIAEYRESIRLFPKDIWARNHLAVLLENNGRYYEAQLLHLDTLEIDEDNPLAKQRLQAMQQSVGQMAVDVSPVDIVSDDIEQVIANAPDASDYPNADVVVLLNKFSHDVLKDGRSRYTTHKLIKILTERGKAHADIAVPFNAQTQNIGVNLARTILPDGTELEPPNDAYSDVTPPGLLSYNLYSDMMWKIVSMPGVVPGAIIEYQVTLEDAVGITEGQKVWFWGGMQFQGNEPVLRNVCAVRVSETQSFTSRVYNIDLQPEIQTTDAHRIYVWRTGEYPAMAVEPSIARFSELIPRVSYASIQSWDQVAEWYRDLAKDRYEADESIRSLTQELTQKLQDHEVKLRSSYNFVTNDIRYVGIEYGQGAYQPTRATDVLRFRYGDCKDKATLLITMFELLGQKAYPALLQPAPYEPVDPSIPSPSQFAHLIVAVPQDDGKYFWLDPTATYCSFGDLPIGDQGRTALVIREMDGELVQTPVFPAKRNQLSIESQLTLHEDGTITGREHVIARGEYNQLYRLTYARTKPTEWKNLLAGEMARRYPGVQIEEVQLKYLDDPNRPVELEVFFRAPLPSQADPSHLVFTMSQPELMNYASLVVLPERTYPLDLGYPMQLEHTSVLELPQGWVLQNEPRNAQQESVIGSFERKLTRVDNRIEWSLQLEIRKHTVPVEEYGVAKRFLEKVAQENGVYLILVKPSS